MKKIFFIFLLTTTICFSQEIHDIPSAYEDDYSIALGNTDSIISDGNILSRINTIITNLDGVDPTMDGFHNNNDGVNSVYFSKRILAHIQLYHYYTNQGEPTLANDQKNSMEFYFDLLLDEQCISYSMQGDCTFAHGGFPANYGNPDYNSDLTANPLPTALALKVFAEIRNFYDALGEQVPINCDEFEDRVYQAKHALYTYQQINYQYINMMGFIQIAATSIHELYDDEWSMDFLIEKVTELFDQTGPLRPFEGGDPDWDKDWNEGQQADGSWKDYGAVYVIGNSILSANGNLLPLDECQKWHDSELDYHSIIIEGLAHSYYTLEPGALRDSTRVHLLRSINHIIDYNGETEPLENPFNEEVIEDILTPDVNDDYAQTRLHRTGRVTKYHRELSSLECVPDPDGDGDIDFDYDKTLLGIGFIRSLIFSRSYLSNLSVDDKVILDKIIAVQTQHLINDSNGANALPADQLYDLSLFLNRDNLHSIQKNISKDKAIVAFKFDDTNTATIVSHKENTTLTLDFNEAIYSHNQEAVDMLSGDFNGNGSDELIITFDGGNTYRYRENSSGFMDTPSLIYTTNGGTIKSEKLAAGDFDGDGIDELIVSFDNRQIKKYSENSVGNLAEDLIISPGTISYINPITNLAVGDFNGDSVDELILVRKSPFFSTVVRYYEDTNGYIVQDDVIYTNTNGIYPIGIQVGNFNEDSKDELIIALSDGNVARYKENSSGNLVTNTNENFYQNNSILPTHIEAGDFNLDGKDELVIAFSNKNISIYEEDGITGYMTFEQNFYSGNQPCSGLSAGDFDGDGVDELLVGFINTVYRCIKNNAGVMLLRSNFNQSGNDVNLITTLRRNRIHCPGGASSRAANTTTDTLIEAPQFNARLVSGKENLEISVLNQTTDKSTLEVYDITGRLLLNEKFEKSIQIDRTKLTNGLYIFIVQNGSDKKIIKTIN